VRPCERLQPTFEDQLRVGECSALPKATSSDGLDYCNQILRAMLQLSEASQAASSKARLRGRKLSDILNTVAADQSRERISIADLFEVLSDRAFGALMLILATPNVLPLPLGTSAVLGAPLVFLATQIAITQHRPWLPKLMAQRSMSRTKLAAIINKAAPWLSEPKNC
jgi:hypothetical protein